MFDSHCHLHDERMADRREACLQRARQQGVDGMLLAGVDPAGWRVQSDLARQHPALALAYGLHPLRVVQCADAALDDDLQALATAVQGTATLQKPCAIGELGLDALTPLSRACLPRQTRAFRAQLALARATNLPVVLHILRTHPQALALLQQDGLPPAGGVVHSYSGSAALVPAYLALGLYISFAGAITLPQSVRLREAARAVPLDRLLVETDAPDQTPLAHRPTPNEPAFLPAVLAALADARREPLDRVQQHTSQNARRLFRLSER